MKVYTLPDCPICEAAAHIEEDIQEFYVVCS